MEDQFTFFRINISENEMSKRCQLKGAYDVVVKDRSVCLCDVRSHRVIYEWPFTCIRKFGKSSTQFTFEAGRKSSTGAGVFNMETGEGSLIVKSMTEEIEKIKAAKGCPKQQTRSNSSEEGVNVYVNGDTIMNGNESVYDNVAY